MTKKQVLSRIGRHCNKCPLRCDENCPLFKLKDGIDTTKEKREMTEKQLLNLKGYQRKISKEVVV